MFVADRVSTYLVHKLMSESIVYEGTTISEQTKMQNRMWKRILKIMKDERYLAHLEMLRYVYKRIDRKFY